MDRVIESVGGLLTAYFEAPDGTPTDPTGTPTVVITAEDGTVVQASANATAAADGTGRVTYTATPTHASRLDLWTVTWTATVAGVARTVTTYADVCGGYLFDIQSLKADLGNKAGTFTQEQLRNARILAEDIFESACGVAFVPRFRSETLSGTGADLLIVAARARSVRSATVDDVAVTDTLYPDTAGTVYLAGGWTYGTENIAIRYEHGYDYPPADVSIACRLLAKHKLVEGPIDSRATTMTDDFGTWTLATPGVRGSETGIPDVDAVINRYSVNAGVA